MHVCNHVFSKEYPSNVHEKKHLIKFVSKTIAQDTRKGWKSQKLRKRLRNRLMVWICAKTSYLQTSKKDRILTLWRPQKRERPKITKTGMKRDYKLRWLQIKMNGEEKSMWTIGSDLLVHGAVSNLLELKF